MIRTVRPSDARWKEGGGYYPETPETLRERPSLPSLSRLHDRRLVTLFDRYGRLAPGVQVLEAGCGRSPWLPFLALHRQCDVVGLDIEAHACALAQANLAGAGAQGRILCRDAFLTEDNLDLREQFDLVYSMGLVEHFGDPEARVHALSRYLRPGGRILTTVPNLRGVNWVMQRLGSPRILEMHVVYSPRRLSRVHEEAGLRVVASGLAGFYDGHLSASEPSPSGRRRLHALLCRNTGRMAALWMRLAGEGLCPEGGWHSAHVYCVAERP
jgi:SAM-dependent methyltransferase